MNPRFVGALPLIIASALSSPGCNRKDPGAGEQPTPGLRASAAAASSRPRPRAKEYAAPPSDRLGKLPDGVGVPVGTVAPDAAIKNAKGADVSLSSLNKTRGALLIVFYRGGWCPYCNFEIHELTAAFPEYQRRGVLPVALSVDKPSEASETSATYTIPFPVLSDPELVAHEAYRVVHSSPDDEVEKLRKFGMDIEAASGKTHHKFAIPALFLVDRSGVVRWAHADPDYKVRPRTPQILAAIDAVKL